MFSITVTSSAAELWDHNPHASFVQAPPNGALAIDCVYPLVNRANQCGRHFVSAFHDSIGKELGLEVPLSGMSGDVHLAQEETADVRDELGIDDDRPMWLVNAGGKFDYTAKWWPLSHYEEVVAALSEEICFVQVGAM